MPVDEIYLTTKLPYGISRVCLSLRRVTAQTEWCDRAMHLGRNQPDGRGDPGEVVRPIWRCDNVGRLRQDVSWLYRCIHCLRGDVCGWLGYPGKKEHQGTGVVNAYASGRVMAGEPAFETFDFGVHDSLLTNGICWDAIIFFVHLSTYITPTSYAKLRRHC